MKVIEFLFISPLIGSYGAKIQMMIVYDHSQGPLQDGVFKVPFFEGLVDSVTSLSDTDVEFALSSFVDKPIPGLGVGPYGGYPGPFLEDYCYARHVNFTTDLNLVNLTLTSLSSGGGLDLQQGHLEGVLGAVYDDNLGWDLSPSTDRVLLLVTDSWTHTGLTSDALRNIDQFNMPIRCLDKTSTAGGFGAIYPNKGDASWSGSYSDVLPYASLHAKRACAREALSAKERIEYEQWHQAFLIRQYPTPKPFDLSVFKKHPEEHCKFHEYASYQQVSSALLKKSIKFIVLVAEPLSFNLQQKISVIWEFTATSTEYGFLPAEITVATLRDHERVTASEIKSVLNAAYDSLNLRNF